MTFSVKMFWEFCLALQKFDEVEMELLNLKTAKCKLKVKHRKGFPIYDQNSSKKVKVKR